MNKKQQILPLLVALLVITNVVTVVVGNYTLFKLKNLIENHYENEAISMDEPASDQKPHLKTKEESILEAIENIYLEDADLKDVREGKYRGMVDALNDPYSQYLDMDDMENVLADTEGEFGGIGVVITPDSEGYITVVSPIEGTPGERAGIRTGDKIIKVEGVEHYADTLNDAVSVMRGEPGTDVSITIRRDFEDGSATFYDHTITRETITIQSVEHEMIEEGIGYIRLTSFDRHTTELLREALDEMKEKDVNGIVMDLRNNPGGLLEASIDVSDIFLNDGIIVYTVNKTNKETDYFADEEWVEYPLVILVNGGSASASEIFAGAIKDNNRGMIVGENTFGKGMVQQIFPFADGTGVKLTTSEYFTPDGIAIDEVGIKPDVEIILNSDIEGIGPSYLEEDNQLNRAISELKELMAQ